MRGTVTKFKFFFAPQDERQEARLRSMAQQGLHLMIVLGVIVGLYVLTTGYAILRILLRLRELHGPLQT